jgi:hypothetical protein
MPNEWSRTFYESSAPGPTNSKRERKMETLTNEEMLQIEGGSWWGFLYAAVMSIGEL